MQARKSLRRRTWEVLEVGKDGDDLSRVLDVMILALVCGNVLATIFESIESIGLEYHELFIAFEHVSIAAFTAEFLCRFWSAADSSDDQSNSRNRLQYILSPMALVDILAIAPYYLIAFLSLDLRFLRIFRLLRLVKLTRYSGALSRVYEVYRLQRSALAASFLLLSITIIFSASLLYAVEHRAQPEAFASIPAAMWWAVCTLTTVGYGDVTPVTNTGKFVASLISLVGIAIVALPTSLFASGFAHIMARNQQTLEEEVREALSDGVLTTNEQSAYDELAEQLYIEPEMAQEIFEAARRKQDFMDGPDCPHCGKSVAG